MTTPAAERLYQAQHMYEMEGRGTAIFNPHNKPLDELPRIYGFNGGGNPGWYCAQLISEDGMRLGGHICSHECYMRHDLGILAGTRPDRHGEDFQKHYPDGYVMEFVESSEIANHAKLNKAFELNKKFVEARECAQEGENGIKHDC